MIATPASSNGSNSEIIADTGSEEDLMSNSDLDVHFKERSKNIPSSALSLITANGPVEVDTKHEVHIEAVDNPLQFVQLPNTPAVCFSLRSLRLINGVGSVPIGFTDMGLSCIYTSGIV